MQIVQDISALPSDVKSLYIHHSAHCTRPTVDEIFKLLQSEVSRYTKTFIVVDALDECQGDQSREALLTTLQSLRPTVNLMVTSRFFDTATYHFDKELEINTSIADVQAYVRERISNERLLWRHVQKDPTLREHITKVVGEKRETSYVFSYLAECFNSIVRLIRSLGSCLSGFIWTY